jgi:hypothetical protein
MGFGTSLIKPLINSALNKNKPTPEPKPLAPTPDPKPQVTSNFSGFGFGAPNFSIKSPEAPDPEKLKPLEDVASGLGIVGAVDQRDPTWQEQEKPAPRPTISNFRGFGFGAPNFNIKLPEHIPQQPPPQPVGLLPKPLDNGDWRTGGQEINSNSILFEGDPAPNPIMNPETAKNHPYFIEQRKPKPETPIPTIPDYEPAKTPEQMEQDRIAAAATAAEGFNAQDALKRPDATINRTSVSNWDKGAFNEAERLYQDQTVEGLKTGKFADVESALNRTGRDTALRTARAQQAGEAAAAQAGYKPGTPEYNKMVQNSVANAEAQNMQDANANRQMQRNYYSDAMNRGQGIGEQMYNRAAGERSYNDVQDATEYSRNDAAYGDDKQDILDYVSSQPPNIQEIMRVAMAEGKDPRTIKGLRDATGAVSRPFRGAEPYEGQNAMVWQDAIAITPRNAGESDAAYNQRVAQKTQEMQSQVMKTKYNPIGTAASKEEYESGVLGTPGIPTNAADFATKWNTPQGRSEIEKAIPPERRTGNISVTRMSNFKSSMEKLNIDPSLYTITEGKVDSSATFKPGTYVIWNGKPMELKSWASYDSGGRKSKLMAWDPIENKEINISTSGE